MTWLGVIGRALHALGKLAGFMATYLLGRNHAAKLEAETAAKNARDANRIDENVRRLCDAELFDELRRK